jgi:hypothetical protein
LISGDAYSNLVLAALVSQYIDVVISSKPNDRVGGQEVYEQLADLLSFAAQCSTSE